MWKRVHSTSWIKYSPHRRSCNILDIPNIKEILTILIDFESITTDDLPKGILETRIKLPKSKRDWGMANKQFKYLLDTDTSVLETEISLMQSTIYDYFAQN